MPQGITLARGPSLIHRTLQPAGRDGGSLLAPQAWPRTSPLSGLQQEAPGPRPPAPGRGCPSGCLSHILSLSVSPLLPHLPVELLGKSNVRPPAAPRVLVPFVCLPQLRATGRRLSGATVPLGPLGPPDREESWATAGSVCQAKRGRAGWVGHRPGLPRPHYPAWSPYLSSPLPGSPSPLHHPLASLSRCCFMSLLLSLCVAP